MARKRTVAIYTRGLNPPHTEGKIAAVVPLAQAIALAGWDTRILNFKYSLQREAETCHLDSRISPSYEIRIPFYRRDSLLHSDSIALQVSASVIEFLLTPLLFAQEMRAKASIVHLVNCFKFPRAAARLIIDRPVIAHAYQAPKVPTFANLPLPVDAMLASSHRIAKLLKSSLHMPVYTIHPSVDTSVYRPNRVMPRGKVVLYMGNLSEGRVPDDLIRVFHRIVQNEPDVFFRLVAPVNPINFSRQHKIRAMSRLLQVENKVLVSMRDATHTRKLEEYGAAKCLIFGALRGCHDVIEPPLTVLEALSCGLPVVATDTNSIGEVVVDDYNGFLVAPERYADLAEVTTRVLQADQSTWRKWSAGARATALSKFSIPSMSIELARMYSAVLGTEIEV